MAPIPRRTFLGQGASLVAAGGASLCLRDRAWASSATNLRVGFASGSLAPAIVATKAYRRPLEAICMAVTGNDSPTVLVALDLQEFSVDFDHEVRVHLRRMLSGIESHRILLHTTHTHSAPYAFNGQSQFALDLATTLARIIKHALQSAVPAVMRTGRTDVGKRLSVNRRGDTQCGLGVQTFWYGYHYREHDDRRDASALVNEMAARWLRQPANYVTKSEPVWFDADVDPLVHAMSFQSQRDGTPLGSLVRFSAHPHLTSGYRLGDRLYDPDFPGDVRDLVQKEIGGQCLCLTGTSGDLVPKEKVDYVLDEEKLTRNRQARVGYFGPTSSLTSQDRKQLASEVQRIGKEIARVAIQSLSQADREPLRSVVHLQQDFDVKLDPNLPKSQTQVDKEREDLLANYQAILNRGGSLSEIRELSIRMNWLEWSARGSFQMLTPQDKRQGTKRVPASMVVLNETPLLFMASEIMAETTAMMRKDLTDADPWTIGLTGGTLAYLPTAEMLKEGGYESLSSMHHPDTEARLREHLLGMLASR